MVCGKCGLQWDINDPDPPDCPKYSTEYGLSVLRDIKKALNKQG